MRGPRRDVRRAGGDARQLAVEPRRGIGSHPPPRLPAARHPHGLLLTVMRETFNAIVGELESPMFIVTARAGAEPLGCLVGFATQTSIDPPRFAVCLSHNNR